MNAFVGGGTTNVAGGTDSGVLSGSGNEACDNFSSIGGGGANQISSSGGGIDATDSFIGAGDGNIIDCTSSCDGDNAIAAGAFNVIYGGAGNSSIGSGTSNTLSSNYAFIGGGNNNNVSGEYGAVAGGNTNTASGTESSIPGGAYNSASGYASFAAGYHADADEAGAFVWSDNSASSTTKATAANEFLARAAGGVTFFTNSTMTTGVKVAAGSGTWSSLSDRAVKTAIESIDDTQVLDKV
ncbi:MAG: hypothetical protein JO199_07885, partial [Candidatus Eremiobacteraeota bacterium]|nr:hypothetical protein [Candidatus Eremiobacteraeota bacterium]